MVFKYFFFTVVSNILHVQYLIKTTYLNSFFSLDNEISFIDNDNVTLSWALQHMGTRGNYPNHQFNDNQDPITLEYDIKQIQLIIRHGTRYPVLSGIGAINEALLKLNESSNDDLIGWMKNYKNEYFDHRAGQLNGRGQEEVYVIGKRLSKKYPQFVQSLIDGDTISSTDFQAFSSWSSRTSQSGQAFCLGLFGGLGPLGSTKIMSVPILSLNRENDSLISLDKACPRWQSDAKKTIIGLMQPVFKMYLTPIASRLSKDWDIGDVTVEDVKNIYDACITEISMHKRIDTFCKVFHRDDIKKLEFIDDLAHYYKLSYGLMDLNEDLACDLGKFILESIEKRSFKLDIKFGHSETTLPLRTFLGLYKDDPLLSINSTQEEVEKRKFRMSKFGYFANNVAFQLLSHKISKELYVRVLDNEVPIQLPGCKDILCSIDDFKAYMTSRIHTCNYKKFCKLAS